MRLNVKQRARYLLRPTHCPFCDTEEITKKRPSVDQHDTIRRTIFCKICNQFWTEIYQLVTVHNYR